MKKVSDYSVTDHGVEHAQYFQGHGIACSDWEDCATGCGNTYNEAFEDALDSLAQQDWDVDGIVNEEKDNPNADKTVQEWEELPDSDMEESELYYYVSIDVK